MAKTEVKLSVLPEQREEIMRLAGKKQLELGHKVSVKHIIEIFLQNKEEIFGEA